MKKFVRAAALCVLVACAATAAGAKTLNPGAAELKKMSVFLSNFTELGYYGFDVGDSGSDGLLHMKSKEGLVELIRFGVWHNYVNNFKSRVKRCADKNCPYGSLTIDGAFVAETVKKYFDIDLKNRNVEGSDFHYDGKLYHFEGADGESVYYAQVKEVFEEAGTLRMTGDVYNAEDESDRPATFEARVTPKTKQRNRYTILSLETQWK